MTFRFPLIPENAAKGTLLSEYTVDISALKVIPVKSADVIVSERKYVIPSGDVFGIRMFTKGVVVVGSDDVYTEEGISNPLKLRALMQGYNIDCKRKQCELNIGN